MSDNVNHPSHYADSCSMECCEAMIVAFGERDYFIFCLQNAFKYLWRHKNKGGVEDLNKAKRYVDAASNQKKNITYLEIGDEMKLGSIRSILDKKLEEANKGGK